MQENEGVWDAYHIVDKGPEKSFWLKVGIAFLNRDQSINVLLDVLPKDGKIQLRSQDKNKNKPNHKKGNYI